MNVIALEDVLKRTMDDIEHVLELTGRRGRLCLYTVSDEEYKHLTSAKKFLLKEFGFSDVKVFMASDMSRYDPENKAERARPKRPGIYLE